jgi:hypothetical protein
VPRTWRWQEFDGIRFAAPGDWRLVRNGSFACPFGVRSRAVVLFPDRNRQMPRCAVLMGTAGTLAASSGVSAERLPDVAGFCRCRQLQRLRLCYSAPPYAGGVLGVAVAVHGRHRMTLLRIGLAGSGVVPRTIIGSIQLG